MQTCNIDETVFDKFPTKMPDAPKHDASHNRAIAEPSVDVSWQDLPGENPSFYRNLGMNGVAGKLVQSEAKRRRRTGPHDSDEIQSIG